MDKPVYIDFQTKICASALNTIADTVWDALGQAKTPIEARQFIDAVEEAPNDGKSYLRASRGWVDSSTVSVVTAAQVSFSPAGTVGATNVQAAIAEVANESLQLTGGTLTGVLTMAPSSASSNISFRINSGTAMGQIQANVNGLGFVNSALTQLCAFVPAGTENFQVTGNVLSSLAPTLVSHLTRKDYVDAQDALNLAKSGGTMTGGLTISKTGVTAPVVGDGNVFSGTYTPGVPATTNVSAITPFASQYMRVGNVVTVSGRMNVTPIAAGNTTFQITLPVASNMTARENLGGSGACNNAANTQPLVIYGDAATDRAEFRFGATVTTASDWYYHFTYRVL